MNSMKRVRTTMVGELSGGIELPGLFTLSNVKSGTTPIIDSDYFEQRINSVLGFGQLSYKGYGEDTSVDKSSQEARQLARRASFEIK